MKKEFFYDVLIASGTVEFFCPDEKGLVFADKLITEHLAEKALESDENPITIGSFKSLCEVENCLENHMPEMAIGHAEKVLGWDNQYKARVMGAYIAVYEVVTTDNGDTDSWDMTIIKYSRFPQREVEHLPEDILPE